MHRRRMWNRKQYFTRVSYGRQLSTKENAMTLNLAFIHGKIYAYFCSPAFQEFRDIEYISPLNILKLDSDIQKAGYIG